MSSARELEQALDVHMNNGSFYHALRIAEQLREETPDDPFIWLKYAQLKSLLGNFEYAIQELKKLTKEHGGFVHGWHNLSAMLVSKGRFVDAEKALRVAIRLDPSDATVWQNLGYVFYRTNRTKAAIRAFRRSLKIEPSVFAWHNLGRIHENEGDMIKASKAYAECERLGGLGI